MRKASLHSVFAGAAALAFVAPNLPAADVTDGAVPNPMDQADTHYIVGATGAYNRHFSGTTIVGDLNTVMLTVQHGSILSGSDALIGYGSTPDATGANSVLVTGAGSKWTTTSGLVVGGNTSGNSLTIANGGAVVTRNGSVGNGGSSANNIVTVTGEGSTWTDSGTTYLGIFGTNNQLVIEDGATATSAHAYIGTNGTASGTATVTGAGSSWAIAGTTIVGRVHSSGTATATGGTGTLIVDDGAVVHAGSMEVAQGPTSTGTLTIASGGTIEFTDALKLALVASSTATLNLNPGGTLQIADNGADAITAGAGAAFNFAGGTLEVRTDPGGGTLTTSAAMTLSNSSTIDTHGNTAALSGNLSGTGSLTKVGAGALTLSGANTYTGATSVDAGTLFVDGSLANTALTIAAGATLGGSGVIGAPTDLLSGAVLAPGNLPAGAGSPGTLTFTHGLNLHDGSALDFQLGTLSDLILVSGGTLTGAASAAGITINFSEADGFNPLTGGSFTLIDFSGATLADFELADFTFGALLAGTSVSNYALMLDPTAHTLSLTYTASAIPEPSTYALLFGAAAGLAVLVQRRSKSRHASHRLQRR